MFGPPQKKFLKAAAAGDMNALEQYCDYDIPGDYSINARGEEGKTALHLAAENGHVEAVRLLVEREADLEAKNDGGSTPLLTAVSGGKGEVAKVLLDAGADANTHSNVYAYPLHWAANNGDIDLVKLLVAKGADVNALTKEEERTPLFYAISKNRGNVSEFLLASGANPDIPGTDGKTDADLATSDNPRIKAIIDLAAAKTQKTVIPAVAPAVPEPAHALAASEDSEIWKLMGADKAAHIGTYPDLNRKITEIFNFATRERLIITENLKTGAETMGSAEKFEALSENAVARATDAWNKLGGNDGAAKKSFNL